MELKPRVLVFIDWFYPAFKAGGPIKSVYNLIKALQDEIHFYLITSNRDVDGSLNQVVENEWTKYEGIQVMYLPPETQRIDNYIRLSKEVNADIHYYNSLYSYRFTLLPYMYFKKSDIRQIIAPRGMLGKGALSVKPLKKKFFLAVAKRFVFNRKNTLWQATSDQEAKDIFKALGNKNKVHLASNLSSQFVSRDRSQISKSSGELKLVFISRILPIKNLNFLLEVIMQIKGNIELDIYGPIEDHDYWYSCERWLNSDNRIAYKGVLKPYEISKVLQFYHAYVLPSDHENYGHGIVEALLCGLPVLISDKTPWKDLEQQGVGKDVSLEIADWIKAIESFYELDLAAYLKMVDATESFSRNHILNKELLEANRKLFYS